MIKRSSLRRHIDWRLARRVNEMVKKSVNEHDQALGRGVATLSLVIVDALLESGLTPKQQAQAIEEVHDLIDDLNVNGYDENEKPKMRSRTREGALQ